VCAGYHAQVSFSDHYDDEDPLTAVELDRHAEVFRAVLDLAPELMTLIQKECFRYSNEVYADILDGPIFLVSQPWARLRRNFTLKRRGVLQAKLSLEIARSNWTFSMMWMRSMASHHVRG
jgi:hypothetical protein